MIQGQVGALCTEMHVAVFPWRKSCAQDFALLVEQPWMQVCTVRHDMCRL